MLCTKIFCAHKKKGTSAFLHTEPLPQRRLCTEQFLHTGFVFLALKKIDTEKNVHTYCAKRNTHRFFCTQKLYPEQFLHSRNSSAQKPLRTVFLCTTILMHSNYYRHMVFTQKVLRTERFTRNIFFYIQTLSYTDSYTRKTNCIELHTETCAHSTLLHATSFYTERFFFPFLITYLSCWPTYGT